MASLQATRQMETKAAESECSPATTCSHTEAPHSRPAQAAVAAPSVAELIQATRDIHTTEPHALDSRLVCIWLIGTSVLAALEFVSLQLAVFACLAGLVAFKTFALLFFPLTAHYCTELPKPTRRSLSVLPQHYPNGWFKILDAHDLRIGQVKTIKALGQELVLFRTTAGQAAVLDAFCSHMGAHLGEGGTVKDGCIVCPFHGWRFGADGKCESIPYSASAIPAAANMRSWPVREVNGAILLWHHVDGAQPDWEPIQFENFEHMRFHGTSEEIPENGADISHLDVVHSDFVLKGFPLTRHELSAGWEASKTLPHVAHVTVDSHVSIAKHSLAFTHVHNDILQVGPGLVYLEFRVKGFNARMVVLQSVTPVAPLLQKMQHTAWAEPGLPRFIVKMVLAGTLRQVDRDVPIWSHKNFTRKPLIVKEDALIGRFRRWYQQFYSDSGNRKRFTSPDDW